MTDTAKNNLRGVAFALAAFAIFSTHDVIVKVLGVDYSTFQIIFFGVLFSFPLVMLMLMRDTTQGNLLPRHPPSRTLRPTPSRPDQPAPRSCRSRSATRCARTTGCCRTWTTTSRAPARCCPVPAAGSTGCSRPARARTCATWPSSWCLCLSCCGERLSKHGALYCRKSSGALRGPRRTGAEERRHGLSQQKAGGWAPPRGGAKALPRGAHAEVAPTVPAWVRGGLTPAAAGLASASRFGRLHA